MAHSEMKNAPPLYGWAIAIAAGLVATGVSFLLIGIEGNGSVAIGAVIALIVGVIFTIAERPPRAAPPAAAAAPTVKAAASPTAAAPAATAPASDTPAAVPGTKPPALGAPQGAADDLKQITGVGPVLETKLNDNGIYHFWQIAQWSADEIAWMDETLNFKGRIERDDWVSQAKALSVSSPAAPAG